MLRFSFRFFSLMFIAGIFFGLANACQLNAQGYGIAGVGTPPTTCVGGTNGKPSRFNNNQSYSALTTFLRAYGFTFDKIDCTNTSQVGNAVSSVQTIQNVLNDLSTTLGKDCGTCVDGKFGSHTQSKIALCMPTCSGTNKAVNSSGSKCDSGYIHDGSIGCCKPIPTNTGNNNTGTGGGGTGGTVTGSTCLGPTFQTPPCASGWTGDGAGCCIAINQNTGTNTGNTCTGTGQIGVQSGTSWVCKDCPDKKIPNSGHTQCVCDPSQGCCGIELNTVVPFIGDCIEISNDSSSANTTRVTPLNAFPRLMGGLSKIIVTAILIFSFVMIVAGGVMITAGGIKAENYSKGMDIIKKVVIALILLGASGIILNLINPNFFK